MRAFRSLGFLFKILDGHGSPQNLNTMGLLTCYFLLVDLRMEYREILQRISVAERHVPLGLQSLGFYHIWYGPHGFSPKKIVYIICTCCFVVVMITGYHIAKIEKFCSGEDKDFDFC